MGLCLLIHAQPVLINGRFAELLGADPEDALRPATWLQQQWPELWPQLLGIGRGQRHVSCATASGRIFNGRAYARVLPALAEGAELITVVDDPQRAQIAFSSRWRARMLLIRQALFVNLARAEVSKPLDGLKLNGIGTLQ